MNPIHKTSFNWLAGHINNLSLQHIKPWIQGVVIDMGCGKKPYADTISSLADHYFGLDWPSSLHDQSHVDAFADLTAPLPLQTASVDTVVSFQVMEHLPEPVFFLRECQRILRPGGMLLLTVPFMWHVHEEPVDYFRYTQYGLHYMLTKTGFEPVEVRANTGFWQTWVLKFNYHTYRHFGWGLFRYCWIPVWWLGQTLSPLLDRYNPNTNETASYTVIARKPA